jgi:16S rRNA G966 N2-methylase RsmD
MATPTYNDVLTERQLTDDDITREFNKLKAYKPKETSRCFAGNPILYHYQLDNLCKVKTGRGSFYDMMQDDAQREDWWIKINKYAHGSRPETPATRLFEIYRRCTGAVVFFKPTIAINMYDKYKATKVLDVCAGWGGRMLGAMAKGIGYTGIDTNTNLKPSYDAMIEKFGGDVNMIWGDALTQDFSQIDYDFALTSPPYWDKTNVEIYEKMNIWKTEKEFYDFLISLINKTRASIRRDGKVAFNISPKMYKTLTEKYKYPACAEAVPMLQQKVRGKDKEDMVYVW